MLWKNFFGQSVKKSQKRNLVGIELKFFKKFELAFQNFLKKNGFVTEIPNVTQIDGYFFR